MHASRLPATGRSSSLASCLRLFSLNTHKKNLGGSS